MSTTVTYKGETLTTVDNATVTLETAGKYCEDDFTLTDVSGGGVEMITVTIYDDVGVMGGNFKEQNATLEQNIDYDLGRVWWVLTTPKNSLFVVHSQIANASTTTTTGTYTSFCQPQQARVQGYVIFAYNLGETDGTITFGI